MDEKTLNDIQKDQFEARLEEEPGEAERREGGDGEEGGQDDLPGEEEAWALFRRRLDGLRRTTALAKVGNGVCILSDDRDGEPYQQMSRAAFLAKCEDLVVEYVDQEGKRRDLSPARAWLRDGAKTRHKRIDYYPEGAPEGVHNLFRGWGAEASEGGSCDLFLDHVLSNVCGGDEGHFAFLMDWVADIFQNPGRKHSTAVVLQGAQGTGKTFFAKTLGRLAGERNFFTVSSTTQLAGRFNSHLAARMLVFADEALPPRCLHESGRIKSLISDDALTVEPKGRDVYQVRNLARLVFASNHDLVVPAENNERRYFVLKVSPARANDTAYFAAVQRQLDGGGLGALMRTLLRRRIAHDLRDCPKTEHLQEQMRLQQDPTQAWFLERLEDGEIRGRRRLDEMFGRYQGDMRECGCRARNKSWFCRSIAKLFPHAETFQDYAGAGGARRRFNTYDFGAWEACRRSFELATGIRVGPGAEEPAAEDAA